MDLQCFQNKVNNFDKKYAHNVPIKSNTVDITVDSKIFAMVLFSQNFAYAKFCENKALIKWRDHSVVC